METFNVVLSNAQSSAGSTAITGASVSKNIIDDDRVTWVITASAAPENAGFSTFKVTRTGDMLQTATISYGSTGRAGTSATPGLDYTPVAGTLTFAPGVAEQYINVPLINDNVAEGLELVGTAEQIVVGISDPSIGVVVTNSASSIVVDDDNIEYTLALGVTVDESAGVMYFSIFRSGNRLVETTIDYSTTGKASSIASPSTANAIAGKDYTPVSGTLTFAVGETYKTVAVAITDDLLGENTEDVIFAIGNASRGNIIVAQIGNNITDNDRMQWSISGGSTVDEGVGQMFFIVTRSGNLQQAASIDYSTTGQFSANQNAIPGKDYSAAFGTLNFAVGESSKTVAVAVTDDARSEANESVVMGISNASQGTITSSSTTSTILDNDLVVWSVAALGAAEGDKMMFTVSRTGNWQQAATIDYSTVSGASTLLAQPGSDFTPTSGTLSFAAGERIKTILVDVSVDTALEPSEQVGLILVNASVGSFVNAAATTSSGTIQADVSAGISSFALAAVEASAWEGSGFAYFTITRSGEVTGTQTINFRTTTVGTATSGTDFTAVPFTTYTFNPGETIKVVAVAINNDTLVEPNETFEAQIGGASAGIITTATTTVTIQDDEANVAGIYGNQTPSAFVLSASQANNWEGAGYAFFTITRNNDASLTSTVDFATNTVGTATAGSDFTAVAATTYTFAPGETVKFVKVAITSDAVAEGNETIQAVLSNATNATITTSTISTTILDDDGGSNGFDGNPTAPQFVLSAVQGFMWEGAGHALYTITRNNDLSSTQSVTFATNAVGTATAGTDFTAVAPTVYTFAPGEAVKVVKVAITSDALAEANETVQAVISSATGGATLGTSSINITIQDDDGGLGGFDGNPSAPSFAVGAGQASVFESNTLVQFTVTRNNDFSGAGQTVNWALTGTAVSGTDYTGANTGTLTFAAGEVTKTFSVQMTNDTVWEGNETVIATISAPSVGSIGTASTTVTIVDTDVITDAAAASTTFALGTTSAANTGVNIDGLDGNDTFTLGSTAIGYANLRGGAGNDTFTVGSATPIVAGAVFDGGTGVDAITFSAAVTLNFANLSDSVFTGIERINYGATTSTVQVALQDVLALTSNNAVANVLRFDSTSAGTLNLQTLGRTLSSANPSSITDVDGTSYSVVASTGTGARNDAAANDVVIGGRTYDVYQYDYNSQTTTLLIDTAITKVVL